MTDQRAPFEIVNRGGNSPYLLICEHASGWIPPEYDGLGLNAADLARHIAWDIGAANVARDLSRRLDASLILAGASRLLIDLNRPVGAASSIPKISEATEIPGNTGLDDAERLKRAETWFHPFNSAVTGLIDERLAAGQPTKLVAVHSFTPIFHGVVRPWDAGILYRRSQEFGGRLVEALGGKAARIAHNQPYQIDDETDYTVPHHGEARGLDAVLVELRQDLIAEGQGAAIWAQRLAQSLAALANGAVQPAP